MKVRELFKGLARPLLINKVMSKIKIKSDSSRRNVYEVCSFLMPENTLTPIIRFLEI